KVLAGQLAEMGEIAGIQLSFEERQLKAVQTQIEQLDALANTADELVNGTAALSDTVRGYFDKLLATLGTTKPSTPGKQPGKDDDGPV
ncbi:MULTISPECIES: hypothetical protein, partial [unclassified Delftia]|uniref:hypothetical protein n=1 Tax=unclassified Delftia TaxID=2613839 RepID=UPI0019026765